jgi:N6-adenosine-specific RNA methylase IME4
MKSVLEALNRREEVLVVQRGKVKGEARSSFKELESRFREMLQQIPETYELIQKYCARTRQSEAFAVLMLVTLPDSFHVEVCST